MTMTETKTTSAMVEQFRTARRRGVPIMVVRTADQFATAASLYEGLSESKVKQPLATWDAVRGIVPFNASDPDARGAAKACGGADETINFVEAMARAVKLPENAVLLAFNAHRQLYSSEPAATAAAIQAVQNLRDVFKQDSRSVVLLAPYFVAPPELEHDVVVIDDPLPGPEDLERVVREIYESTGQKAPAKDVLAKAVEALGGLSRFASEQVAAMSMTGTGLDMDALWERKRLTIEQTRGLRVYRGKERLDDIVGLDNVKARLRARLQAKTPVGVVVVIDEIDKALANVEHDTTGVRMDQLRTLLTEMEDNRWHGMTLVGVPGAGKTMLAKAFGNEAGVPTIFLDLGDMEGPHVGESEAMLRTAIKVIKAVGRGHAFFIATSNNATVMRPELQRRFTKGTFFIDLMTDAERAAAWTTYLAKLGVDASQPRPNDDGWTGAEIRNCVEEAWDTGATLVEASRFIMPVTQGRAEEINDMRARAHGKYLSASEPGFYDCKAPVQEAVMKQVLRRIDLPTEKGKVN